MKTSCKNKSDRMTAKESRRLVRLIPPLLAFYEFKQIRDEPAYVGGVWARDCPRFEENGTPCTLEVRPIADEEGGHPWLACCFRREGYRDPAKPWNDAVNWQHYRDIEHCLGGDSVNLFSGKYNQHVFTRCTAEQCLGHFEQHLRTVFRGGEWFDCAAHAAALRRMSA